MVDFEVNNEIKDTFFTNSLLLYYQKTLAMSKQWIIKQSKTKINN